MAFFNGALWTPPFMKPDLWTSAAEVLRCRRQPLMYRTLLLLYLAACVGGNFTKCEAVEPTVREDVDTFQVNLDGVECRVAWISHRNISERLQSKVEENDFVLTDSLKTIPFAARNGQVVFLEKLLSMPRIGSDALDSILSAKEHLLLGVSQTSHRTGFLFSSKNLY